MIDEQSCINCAYALYDTYEEPCDDCDDKSNEFEPSKNVLRIQQLESLNLQLCFELAATKEELERLRLANNK
jgi:hypothetical protein